MIKWNNKSYTRSSPTIISLCYFISFRFVWFFYTCCILLIPYGCMHHVGPTSSPSLFRPAFLYSFLFVQSVLVTVFWLVLFVDVVCWCYLLMLFVEVGCWCWLSSLASLKHYLLRTFIARCLLVVFCGHCMQSRGPGQRMLSPRQMSSSDEPP